MKQAVANLLRDAVALQESGRLDQAEAVYGKVLEHDPACADAWHLLGRIALARGQWQPAAARVLEAIRLAPSIPAFHSTLGESLAADGRTKDAKLCYWKALEIDHGFVPALIQLGNALQQEGNYADACIAYGRAIDSEPQCAAAFNNLGNAFRAQGRIEEAVVCYHEARRIEPLKPESPVNLAALALGQGHYEEAESWARRALELSPGLAAALSNLSVALLNQSKFDEAEERARAAVAANPAAAHLHSNLGSVLLQQKRFSEAADACRRALALRPEYPEAMSNLAVALQFAGELDDAAAECEAVLRLRPDFAEGWTNLGTVRQQQGRHLEAMAAFDEALMRSPEHPKAHFCRSLSLLTLGRLDEGFAEYEWRWKTLVNSPEGPPRTWRLPSWDGSALGGRRILVHAEQGLGDTIQFARFLPKLAEMGGHVILECQAKVACLIAGIPGVSSVITREEELPVCDVQAALMSLPHLLGTTLDTIPSEVPYLQAPYLQGPSPAQPVAGNWRVGLAWAGNPAHSSDSRRSIPFEALEPIRRIPGIEWSSLHAGGISELANLIAGLDLIISVDTMAAHLAGALGRPVWTLLAHAADWRWLEGREDSPWYPTMRLFRQPAAGDWNSVIERVARELFNLCKCESMSIHETRGNSRSSSGNGGRTPQKLEHRT